MNKKKIQSLQSLRFFAALGVVQYHLWQNYLGVSIGHPGTDFFLVLVGFVTAYTQAKRIPDGGFLHYIKLRYVRLYVTYVPLFIITVIAKWNEVSIDWVIRSFFFIPIPDRGPVIGCTWMLSMFMVFYYLFSISFLVRTEKILWLIFGIWVIFILAYSWLDWQPGIPSHWANTIFAERNIDFILGYIAGNLLRRKRFAIKFSHGLAWFGMIGVVIGTILLNSGFNSSGRAIFLGLPVAIFVLGVAILEKQSIESLIVRGLSVPWLVWLGGTSYVLYLSHSMFIQLWSRILPVTALLVPIITLGAITTGIFGYVFWEEPILKSIRYRKWEYPVMSNLPLNLRKIIQK